MEVIVKKLLMAALMIIPVCLKGMGNVAQFNALYNHVEQAIVDPNVVNPANIDRLIATLGQAKDILSAIEKRAQEEGDFEVLRNLIEQLGVSQEQLSRIPRNPSEAVTNIYINTLRDMGVECVSALQRNMQNMRSILDGISSADKLRQAGETVEDFFTVDQGAVAGPAVLVVEHRAFIESENKFNRIGKIAYAIFCALGAGFGLEYVLNNDRSRSTSGVRTELSIQVPGVDSGDDQNNIGLGVLKALSAW